MTVMIKRNIVKETVPRYHNPKAGIRGKCYLCTGSVAANTDVGKQREHIVPRILFAPDQLEQPLILSACTKCNGEKGYDEEYVARHMQVSSAEKSPVAHAGFMRAFNKAKSLQPKILVRDMKRDTKGTGIIGQMGKLVQGIDMYSKGGIYLGEYGQLPLDGARFDDFYIRMAKGFFTAATGEIMNWDDWKIGKKWGAFSYQTHLTPDQFLFAYQHGQYQEDWGSSFGYAGFVHTRDDGTRVSMWSFGIFNEQVAVVSFMPNALAARLAGGHEQHEQLKESH